MFSKSSFIILPISLQVFWKYAGRPFGPRDFLLINLFNYFQDCWLRHIEICQNRILCSISVMLNFCLGEKTDWKRSFSMSTCSLRFVLLMLQLITIFGRLGVFFRYFKCSKIASVFRMFSSFSSYISGLFLRNQ